MPFVGDAHDFAVASSLDAEGAIEDGESRGGPGGDRGLGMVGWLG
jgi:hypothetical protein